MKVYLVCRGDVTVEAYFDAEIAMERRGQLDTCGSVSRLNLPDYWLGIPEKEYTGCWTVKEMEVR